MPTGVLIQKNTFLQTFGRTDTDADALYIVHGGSNDLFAAIDDVEHNRKDPAAAEANTIRDAMANLGKIIGDLSDRGARHFLVPNLGDLGKLPSLLNTPLSSFASQASAHFNDALERLLAGFSGLDIRRLDIHAAPFDARTPARLPPASVPSLRLDHRTTPGQQSWCADSEPCSPRYSRLSKIRSSADARSGRARPPTVLWKLSGACISPRT